MLYNIQSIKFQVIHDLLGLSVCLSAVRLYIRPSVHQSDSPFVYLA